MATLQVKGMDDRLYKALGARARRDNRSVSQEVVTLIRGFLAGGSSDPRQATEALLSLAGSWQDSRSARRIASDLRKARRSKRRFGRGAHVPA